MKQFKLAGLSFLALSLISTAAYTAETIHAEKSSPETKHTVGLIAGVATGEYKNSNNDGDGFIQAYLYYNYQIVDHLFVELAYTAATERNTWECKENNDDEWNCRFGNNAPIFNLLANDFEQDGFVVAIKGDIDLSQRNSLYGKIGAQYYDYEFTRNDHFIEGDTGTGLFLEAGWQYRWDLGIGMNVGLRYQDMDDLSLASTNVGISYSF